LIHAQDACRPQFEDVALAGVDDLAGNCRFMSELRFPFGVFLIQMMTAVDVGLTVGGFVGAGDVGFFLEALPGVGRMVVGHTIRGGHSLRLCLQTEDVFCIGFEPCRFAIRRLELGLVDIVINVVAEDDDVAEFTGCEVAIQPFLLHQQMDEIPIAQLILQTEGMLGISAAGLEQKLVAVEVMLTQDGFNDLRRGLFLEDATGVIQAQTCHQRLDDEFVAVEIVSLFKLVEVRDATGEDTRFMQACGEAETGFFTQIVSTVQFLRMREPNADAVGFAELLDGFKGDYRQQRGANGAGDRDMIVLLSCHYLCKSGSLIE
jgi:hypothetical protein